MNDAPLADAVRARMQLVRCEIDEDVEDMVASARSMVDWKHFLDADPGCPDPEHSTTQGCAC